MLFVMIEFCTLKRMAITIGLLIILSVVVLVVEDSYSPSVKKVTPVLSHWNSTAQAPECDHVEKVLETCKPCTSFDLTTDAKYCEKTGYREKVQCSKSGLTFRSCPRVKTIEKRNFWIFECVTLMVGVMSYAVAFMRQRRLDRLLMEKVHKQIAAGV